MTDISDTVSTDNVTTDHVYDGIQEYDNPLPGWWTAIFWGTIVFSVAYFFIAMVRADLVDTRLLYEQEVAADQERQFAALGELQPDAATLMSFLEDPEWTSFLT